MSVTKRHVFMLFMRGDSIQQLVAHYSTSVDWVESALRKYMGKAHR